MTRARLDGVDAARGVALLGMTAVHVFPATDDGGQTTAYLLASGRAAALFAVLAGVGVALATGGTTPLRGTRRGRAALALVVRGLLVGLLGLLLAELDAGVAVILAYYAVLFVVAVPLLGRGPRLLAALAAAVAVVAPFVSFAVRDDLPRSPSASPTVSTLVDDPLGLLQTVTITGYYPLIGWTAYLCAGLAVGRLALRGTRTALALLVGGALLAVAAIAVSRLLLGPLGGADRIAEADDLSASAVDDAVGRLRAGNVPTSTPWWLAADGAHSTTPIDLLHTTGTALAVLGLTLLLAARAGRLTAPLAAAGSMPLTLYTSHLLVLAIVDDDVAPLPFWLAQVLAGLLLAVLWRRLLGRGPLEAPLAVLTRTLRGGDLRNADPPIMAGGARRPA